MPSSVDDLRALADMRKDGLITPDEYDTEVARLSAE